MQVEVIEVPYDSGYRGLRMGAGPGHLLKAGLVGHLAGRGYDVRRTQVHPSLEFTPEIATTFDLATITSEAVRRAVRAGRFPLVLSGNCSSALGTVAGLRPAPVGVAWFDAHGDLNTPETSRSGFLDGMTLAILTGRCWVPAAAGIAGFSPVAERDVVLIGARAFDREETAFLSESPIVHLRVGSEVESGLASAMERFSAAGLRLYVHVDLDVLDPAEGRANEFAAPGGVTLEELLLCLRLIGKRCQASAAGVCAIDPAADTTDRMVRAAFAVIETLLPTGSPGADARADVISG